jgi:hypothetical protein
VLHEPTTIRSPEPSLYVIVSLFQTRVSILGPFDFGRLLAHLCRVSSSVPRAARRPSVMPGPLNKPPVLKVPDFAFMTMTQAPLRFIGPRGEGPNFRQAGLCRNGRQGLGISKGTHRQCKDCRYNFEQISHAIP